MKLNIIFLIIIFILERVPLTISYHLYFSIPVKFGACYITGQWGRGRSKQCNSLFTYTFLGFFVVFINKFVFLSFSFFFDEVSNFHKRILTNQKTELAIRNCQWDCMLRIKLIKYKKSLIYKCNIKWTGY